jgi:hypothetical protein
MKNRKDHMRLIHFYVLLFFVLLISCKSAWAEEYLDNHFFLSTIFINDPLVSDKLIVTNTRTESPAENGGDIWTTNPQILYGKTITKNLQISLTESYLHIQNPGQNTENGFDDLNVGARYNVFHHPQSIFSIALNAAIGGSGSHIVNAASTTTISPEILFAQGFANISDHLKYLKPFSLFIAIAPAIVTSDYTVTSVNVGAAIEYNLPFLQQYIEHFNSPLVEHLVPIIEFPFNICTQGICDGKTTGTINPGLIAFNEYGQFGFEAMIPSNSDTGNKVGGVIQVHLYLDNLLPNSIGKPIF